MARVRPCTGTRIFGLTELPVHKYEKPNEPSAQIKPRQTNQKNTRRRQDTADGPHHHRPQSIPGPACPRRTRHVASSYGRPPRRRLAGIPCDHSVVLTPVRVNARPPHAAEAQPAAGCTRTGASGCHGVDSPLGVSASTERSHGITVTGNSFCSSRSRAQRRHFIRAWLLEVALLVPFSFLPDRKLTTGQRPSSFLLGLYMESKQTAFFFV